MLRVEFLVFQLPKWWAVLLILWAEEIYFSKQKSVSTIIWQISIIGLPFGRSKPSPLKCNARNLVMFIPRFLLPLMLSMVSLFGQMRSLKFPRYKCYPGNSRPRITWKVESLLGLWWWFSRRVVSPNGTLDSIPSFNIFVLILTWISGRCCCYLSLSPWNHGREWSKEIVGGPKAKWS